MYLLHQGNLGGHANGNYLARRSIGICLCGESYYNDGTGHIVSSGGNERIEVWSEPSFQLQSSSRPLNGEAGFFTTVSSNGSQNAIIWAVDRPAQGNGEVTLYAYDPAMRKIVFSAAAGTWPGGDAHPNLVPVVANGHVYVASYQQLTIWGLPAAAAAPSRIVKLSHPALKNPVQLQPGEHDIFGTITAMSGTTITIKKRDGTAVSVNTANATTGPLMTGEAVQAVGKGTNTGLDAKWVARAQGVPNAWFPDR